MTREQYIEHRNANSLEPLYLYYVQEWERIKKGTFLNPFDFTNFFKMWPEANIVYNNIMAYYDCKFEVFALQDLRTGNIIKYY